MTPPLSSHKSAGHSPVFYNDSIIMEKRSVTVTFFYCRGKYGDGF